jgi:hypothetical protein
MFTLAAPPGIQSYQARDGTQYVVSSAGLINVPLSDLGDAQEAGFTPVSGTYSGRVINAAGPVTMTAADDIIEVAQATPAACTVNLPTNPILWKRQTVKDGAGNAGSNPITLVPPSGTIDSSSISVNNGAITFYWNGTNFKVVG